MRFNKYKYTINDTYEEKEDKPLVDFLDKIETTIHLTRKEAEEKLIAKEYSGECVLEYNGLRRNDVIISGSTNGSMKIGLLRET